MPKNIGNINVIMDDSVQINNIHNIWVDNYCDEHVGVQPQYFTRQADKLKISISQFLEGFGDLLQVFKGVLIATTQDCPQDSHFVFYSLNEFIMFQLYSKSKYIYIYFYIDGRC